MPITPGPYVYEADYADVEDREFETPSYEILSTTSKALRNDGGECSDNVIVDSHLGICNEDDARLLAASWDMLVLLQELIDIEGPQPGTRGWAEKVRAVIAKATGAA